MIEKQSTENKNNLKSLKQLESTNKDLNLEIIELNEEINQLKNNR